jgi:hypothetical protein
VLQALGKAIDSGSERSVDSGESCDLAEEVGGKQLHLFDVASST